VDVSISAILLDVATIGPVVEPVLISNWNIPSMLVIPSAFATKLIVFALFTIINAPVFAELNLDANTLPAIFLVE
jgi:hypothetical protein